MRRPDPHGGYLFPEEKAFPTIGQSSRDIVENSKNDQQDKNCKANLHHNLLDFLAKISAGYPLQEKNEKMSAIKHRNREQVNDSQLEADDGNLAYHGDKSHAESCIRDVGNLYRTPELAGRGLSGDQIFDEIYDQEGQLYAFLETLMHCGE